MADAAEPPTDVPVPDPRPARDAEHRPMTFVVALGTLVTLVVWVVVPYVVTIYLSLLTSFGSGVTSNHHRSTGSWGSGHRSGCWCWPSFDTSPARRRLQAP